MKKIAFIVSTPMTAQCFLKGHVSALAKFCEVDLIANFSGVYGTELELRATIDVRLERKVHLWRDIKALLAIIRILRARRYDAVHTVTPKAGLLGMFASCIVGVPLRHHTFTGQVWATRSGLVRRFLRFLDRIIYLCSTRVLVDSASQREFLISEGVISAERSLVLAKGSISGVDTIRFSPDNLVRSKTRSQYGIRDTDVVFLFLGRVNQEKGVLELLSAFRMICSEFSQAILMIVGPDEGQLFTDDGVVDSFAGRLIRVGFTSEPEIYFNAADVFCLPSHREGFGSVIIEAASCGIPSVASNIYGISDAIIDGVTGLLHTPKSAEGLRQRMSTLLSNPGLRIRLATAARRRAVEEFSSVTIENAMINFYRSSFASQGK